MPGACRSSAAGATRTRSAPDRPASLLSPRAYSHRGGAHDRPSPPPRTRDAPTTPRRSSGLTRACSGRGVRPHRLSHTRARRPRSAPELRRPRRHADRRRQCDDARSSSAGRRRSCSDRSSSSRCSAARVSAKRWCSARSTRRRRRAIALVILVGDEPYYARLGSSRFPPAASRCPVRSIPAASSIANSSPARSKAPKARRGPLIGATKNLPRGKKIFLYLLSHCRLTETVIV